MAQFQGLRRTRFLGHHKNQRDLQKALAGLGLSEKLGGLERTLKKQDPVPAEREDKMGDKNYEEKKPKH